MVIVVRLLSFSYSEQLAWVCWGRVCTSTSFNIKNGTRQAGVGKVYSADSGGPISFWKYSKIPQNTYNLDNVQPCLVQVSDNWEKNIQNYMFSYPMIGQCLSSPIVGQCLFNCCIIEQCIFNCPMVWQYVSNCPMVGQWMSNCLIIGQCIFNCLMVWPGMSNCPIVGQCMYSCPMILQLCDCLV